MAFTTTVENTAEQQSIIILKDLSSNTFAEIYSFGALLNKFCVEENDGLLNVIEGFSSPDEAKDKITPFFRSAKLSPFACRIKDSKFKFGEKNYQLQKYSSHNHALHGLIFNEVFSITESYFGDTAASVTLEYVYNNANYGYPFCYKCAVKYQLTS